MWCWWTPLVGVHQSETAGFAVTIATSATHSNPTTSMLIAGGLARPTIRRFSSDCSTLSSFFSQFVSINSKLKASTLHSCTQLHRDASAEIGFLWEKQFVRNATFREHITMRDTKNRFWYYCCFSHFTSKLVQIVLLLLLRLHQNWINPLLYNFLSPQLLLERSSTFTRSSLLLFSETRRARNFPGPTSQLKWTRLFLFLVEISVDEWKEKNNFKQHKNTVNKNTLSGERRRANVVWRERCAVYF